MPNEQGFVMSHGTGHRFVCNLLYFSFRFETLFLFLKLCYHVYGQFLTPPLSNVKAFIWAPYSTSNGLCLGPLGPLQH